MRKLTSLRLGAGKAGVKYQAGALRACSQLILTGTLEGSSISVLQPNTWRLREVLSISWKKTEIEMSQLQLPGGGTPRGSLLLRPWAGLHLWLIVILADNINQQTLVTPHFLIPDRGLPSFSHPGKCHFLIGDH